MTKHTHQQPQRSTADPFALLVAPTQPRTCTALLSASASGALCLKPFMNLQQAGGRNWVGHGHGGVACAPPLLLLRCTHRLMFLTRSLAASWFIRAMNCSAAGHSDSEGAGWVCKDRCAAKEAECLTWSKGPCGWTGGAAIVEWSVDAAREQAERNGPDQPHNRSAGMAHFQPSPGGDPN
jgi:hypothetical protein